MKPTIAIFLMICLQVAMSPLCLCFGANTEKESAKPSCCHVPETEEPAPCPHCDQEMPMAATSPVKGDFSVDPPEWHGFDQFIEINLFDALRVSLIQSPAYNVIHELKPPPRPFSEVYGVFLI
ncbi:MAG: hypothetical protein P1U86_17910 [Verrucomicrobiales bacterium]|nr:hypothetical protein [Verrucomicrobiales bacterium]